MQVILRENVENLGRIGDIVKVSDGYARNFLLPRNLVMQADEKNIEQIEHQKRTLEKKRQAQKAVSQELAAKLNNFNCTISRKTGENDKIFGSVSVGDIAEALRKAGHTVDKRSIILEAPIKALGTYTVTVRLEPEVAATIQVGVVKEE